MRHGEDVNEITEVTGLLRALEAGDRAAQDRVPVLLYAELKAVAGSMLRGERRGHSPQPTALVSRTLPDVPRTP